MFGGILRQLIHMMMFNNIVTIFNFDITNNKFLKTVLTDVEYQFSFSVDRLPTYNEANDRCLLFINTDIYDSETITPDGKKFVHPKEWDSLSSKTGYFTLKTDKDFFALGDFSGVTVTNFESFKNLHPNSTFLIDEWREFQDVIPHLEVYGN